MRNFTGYNLFFILLIIVAISFTLYSTITNKKEISVALDTVINENTSIIIEDDFKPTYNYIKDSGCSDSLPNNTWNACAEIALEKIKAEKQNYFNKFINLIKNSPDNVLTWDKEMAEQFNSWYENSNKNNHERCLANAYWMYAGTGYKGGVAICEVFETQRDIELLKENYGGFKDWNDSIGI